MNKEKQKFGSLSRPLSHAFNRPPESFGLSLHREVNRHLALPGRKLDPSRHCNFERAMALLDHGAVSVRKDEKGLLPSGTTHPVDLSSSKHIVSKPNAPDLSFFAGDSTLMTAVRMLHDGEWARDSALVGKMLEKGFDPNERNDAGLHPLTAALIGANSRVIAALVLDPRTRLDPVLDGADKLTAITLTGAPVHADRLREKGMGQAADRLERIVSEAMPGLFPPQRATPKKHVQQLSIQ